MLVFFNSKYMVVLGYTSPQIMQQMIEIHFIYKTSNIFVSI